jgi:hypothetical protein
MDEGEETQTETQPSEEPTEGGESPAGEGSDDGESA